MKKLIILILICVFCFGFTIQDEHKKVIARKNATTACVRDTGTLVMDSDGLGFSTDGTVGDITVGTAYGQSISYGSEWQLEAIEIRFPAGKTDCVCTVRICATDDCTTYMEEWTGISPIDDAVDTFLVSVDNDTYSASTTYYIGIMETSGYCDIRYDNTSPPYAGGSAWTAGPVWNMGSADTSLDYFFNVYKCQ